jgi:hypothetical protein
MTGQILDWKKFPIPGLAPLREDRQDIQLRIEVCAFNRAGRFFSEVTETSDISESGCRCALRTEIASDAVLAIRIVNDRCRGMESGHPILFRTARIERTSGGWMVSASTLQQNDAWAANLSAIGSQPGSKFD